MGQAGIRTVLLVAVALLTAPACGRDPLSEAAIAGPPTAVAPPTVAPTTAAPTTVAPTTLAPTTASRPTTAAPTTVAPTTAARPTAIPPPPARPVTVQAYTPFATVGGVTLTHPSARVERIGYHEANHDGTQQLEPLSTSAPHVTMEARIRATGSRTAADVVVDPESEIRAPVTGRVIGAGTYVLYCKYSDDIAVIEPDDHPGWQVKMLHIDGVQVRYGQRVTAGQTVIAPRATQLPFESQVDKYRTVEPAWPHVHIEVIDPSIPDIPNPNSGC